MQFRSFNHAFGSCCFSCFADACAGVSLLVMLLLFRGIHHICVVVLSSICRVGLFQPFGRCCRCFAASSTHVLVLVFLLFRSFNHAFVVVVLFGVVVFVVLLVSFRTHIGLVSLFRSLNHAFGWCYCWRC